MSKMDSDSIINWNLELKDFKCYRKKNFFFSDGLTLITGLNGKGKSTILDAICWCLYGIGEKVSNRDKPGAKVIVTLSNNKGLIITRSTLPCQVKVINCDKSYEGEAAESEICNLFVSKTLFRGSYYIPCRSLHILLSGSAAEKADFIHVLAYNGENIHPTVLLETASVLLKELKSQRDIAFASSLAVGSCDHDECPVVVDVEENVERQYENIERELEGSKRMLKEKDERLRKLQSDQVIIDMMDGCLPTTLVVVDKEINQCENNIKLAKSAEGVKMEKNRLISLLDGVSTLKGCTDIKKEVSRYHRYVQGLEIATKYKIDYNTSIISTRIEYLEKLKRDNEKITDVKRQLEKIDKSGFHLVDELKKKHNELREEKEDLVVKSKMVCGGPCPSCGVIIHQTQKGFELGGILEQDKKLLLDRLKVIDGEMKFVMEKLKDIGMKQDKVTMLELSIQDIKEEDYDENELRELRTIQVVEGQIFTLDALNREDERRKNKEKLDSLPDIIDIPDVSELENKLSKLRMQQSLIRKLNDVNCDMITQRIKEITSEIETIQSRISHLENEKEVYKQKVIDKQTAIRLKYEHEKCDKQRKLMRERQEKENKYNVATRVVAIIEKKYHMRMDNTINSLNQYLSEISKLIYPREDIMIQLKNHRQLKNKQNKYGVTVEVFYNGVDVGYRGVSDGQETRISYALMLAVQCYRPCPFLLQDEVFYGVDQEVRPVCVDVLKRLLGSSASVLIIEHQETDSEYDACISL